MFEMPPVQIHVSECLWNSFAFSHRWVNVCAQMDWVTLVCGALRLYTQSLIHKCMLCLRAGGKLGCPAFQCICGISKWERHFSQKIKYVPLRQQRWTETIIQAGNLTPSQAALFTQTTRPLISLANGICWRNDTRLVINLTKYVQEK